MSDDLKNTGNADDIRININQEHEVDYWCKKFDIKPELLKEAVGSAGPMVKDVENWLGDCNSTQK